MMKSGYLVYEKIYRGIKEKPDPHLRITAAWLEGIFRAADEGKPIVYHQFTMYSDLMVALDIQPLCTELWDTFLIDSFKNASYKSGDAAVAAGIPSDLCSFNKAIIGSVLRGTIPQPTMIVVPAMPCLNAAITCQCLARLTGAPLWVGDVPHDMDEDGAMEYWVNQYKGLISFLEQHSGKKMDYDRLREVVEETNRCVEYWLEARELQKLRPAPYSGSFALGNMTAVASFGSSSNTAIVKEALDQIRERVATGQTAVPHEKARVIWFHYPVFWDYALESWVTEMGAVIIFTLIDDFRVEPVDTSTPESMIRGLAKRALMTPMGRLGRGGYNSIIENLLYAVQEWKGDCVIIPAHRGCRWFTGGLGLIRDVCRDHGIPLLILDIDLVDPRITSAVESRARIEQFLSIVMRR